MKISARIVAIILLMSLVVAGAVYFGRDCPVSVPFSQKRRRLRMPVAIKISLASQIAGASA
jgi:hypothetical protein